MKWMNSFDLASFGNSQCNMIES